VASPAVQWERRTRMISGALYVAIRRRRQLRPSAGLVAAEFWGHRLVRYTVSPVAHLVLLLIAATRARSSAPARFFLLVHVFAGAGVLAQTRAPRPAHHADPGVAQRRNLLTSALARAGQVCSCRGWRWVVCCGSCVVTSRPNG
jgi:hypothetical protein